MKTIQVALVALTAIFHASGMAGVWVRGSAMVMSASPEVDLTLPGGDVNLVENAGAPFAIPGLFSVSAAHAESIFIHTSNSVDLAFRGEGYFAIERFEGELAVDSNALDDVQSRMILSLRQGLLVCDTRRLSDDSQFILETPFGRIFGSRALWFIEVEYDRRSGIYDFTLACADGSIRLTDKSKQSYAVLAGQRVAGAGNYMTPAIEVAANTDEVREEFEEFEALRRQYDFEALDYVAMRAQMVAMPERGENTVAHLLSKGGAEGQSDSRPIVIEYAPRAPAKNPFRGLIRPPSEWQTDIF